MTTETPAHRAAKRDPKELWKIGLLNFDPWKTTFEEINSVSVELANFEIELLDCDMTMLLKYKRELIDRCFAQWKAAQFILPRRKDIEEYSAWYAHLQEARAELAAEVARQKKNTDILRGLKTRLILAQDKHGVSSAEAAVLKERLLTAERVTEQGRAEDEKTLSRLKRQLAEAQTDVKKLRKRNSLLIMWAVDLCLANGLVAPEWLAKAFHGGFECVEKLEMKTWDEAFGKPHGTKHFKKVQKWREKAIKIYQAVMEAHWSGDTLTIGVSRKAFDKNKNAQGAFGRVGRMFKIPAKAVEKIYSAVKAGQESFDQLIKDIISGKFQEKNTP